MTELSLKTEPDKTGHFDDYGITEQQFLAILELVKGASDAKAARAAGVSRQTVNGWLNNNPAFRTVLRNKQAEMWHETIKPMREALLTAMVLVNKAITNGDVRTAQWLLEKVGLDDLVKKMLADMHVVATTPEHEANCIASQKAREMMRAAENEAERRLEKLGIDQFDDIFKYDDMKKKFTKEAVAMLKKEAEKNEETRMTDHDAWKN